jgi:hypothetical protein
MGLGIPDSNGLVAGLRDNVLRIRGVSYEKNSTNVSLERLTN